MMNCHWRNAPTAGSVRLKAEQDLLGWLAQIVWFCVGWCTVRRHLPRRRAVSSE